MPQTQIPALLPPTINKKIDDKIYILYMNGLFMLNKRLAGLTAVIALSAGALYSPLDAKADGTNTNAPILSIERKLSGTNVTYKLTARNLTPGKSYTWESVDNMIPGKKGEVNNGWYWIGRKTLTASSTNDTFTDAADIKRFYRIKQND